MDHGSTSHRSGSLPHRAGDDSHTLAILWRTASDGPVALAIDRALVPLLGRALVSGVAAFTAGLLVWPWETITASAAGLVGNCTELSTVLRMLGWEVYATCSVPDFTPVAWPVIAALLVGLGLWAGRDRAVVRQA